MHPADLAAYIDDLNPDILVALCDDLHSFAGIDLVNHHPGWAVIIADIPAIEDRHRGGTWHLEDGRGALHRHLACQGARHGQEHHTNPALGFRCDNVIPAAIGGLLDHCERLFELHMGND